MNRWMIKNNYLLEDDVDSILEEPKKEENNKLTALQKQKLQLRKKYCSYIYCYGHNHDIVNWFWISMAKKI